MLTFRSMEQEDNKSKKEEEQPPKTGTPAPSLKERIEKLKEHNEFLENPMKEHIEPPEDDAVAED